MSCWSGAINGSCPMGSSKTDTEAVARTVAPVRRAFAEAMGKQGFRPGDRFLVAFSGGLDSSVLLDLITRYSDDPQNLVRVIHVHHGLHADADRWLAHSRAASQRMGLDFHGVHVAMDTAGGNLEATARSRRYRVMLAHLRDDETLLLAHHRGDTAETFFLNLMRGAGARGLSGIPALAHRSGKRFFRPLQQLSRTDIFDYANLSGLSWVEDDSNADLRFDRNFLRHRVLPLLNERWPGSEKMIDRACRNLAHVAALADELGAADLLAVTLDDRRPGARHQLQLSRQKLMQLTSLRRQNLLRHALATLAPYPPDRRFMRNLLALVEAGENDKQLVWGEWIAHVYDDQLFFYRADIFEPVPDDLDWHLAAETSVRWGPFLIKVDQPADIKLKVRARRGGEKLQLAGRAHRHALKGLLQAWRVPPWQRGVLPLIWREQKLVAIPGYLQPAQIAGIDPLQALRFDLRDAP